MKILLSTPPGETTERWPPLGLLYIAAETRRHRDDEIGVIDAYCESLSREELIRRVLKEQPDVFGMNCSTHTFLDAIGTLGELHRALPDTVLVMGGFHATFAAERILRDYPFVEFIVKGEAERAFPKVLGHIEAGTKPSDVEGISFMDEGAYKSNPIALIEDLDSLPFPARELAQRVEYGYSHQGVQLTFGKFTTICSARGCPYKCGYCSCSAFSQRRWRPRSAESVVDELETLYGQGYECCVFVDDNFTHGRKRVETICELIRARGIKMQFYCEGRVDNAPYPFLRMMKKAGFNVIYFGVESASPHVLDYYEKTITPEKALQAVANAKKAGMIVVTSYIFGAPVESKEDILRTIGFIKSARPHAVQINILDCLIGTPIWDDFVKAGTVGPNDWKTNHRIYEYHEDGLSRKELEDLVNLGYASYLDAWKNRKVVPELLRTIAANRTARKVILGNLFNPNAKKRIAEGMRAT